MAIAIIAGILAGAVSLVPMFAGLHSTKHMDAQQSPIGYLTPVLLAIGGSFIILALATVVCAVVARSSVVPFALTEACTLVLATLGYGIAKAFRK